MRDWYINSTGKKTVVKTMPDAHLINAMVKYKKRLADLRGIIEMNPVASKKLEDYEQETALTYKLLRDEFENRGLV